MAALTSVGIIEKDTHGDILWVWVYPSICTELRKIILQNCCLTWDTAGGIVPLVYTQYNKQWLYIHTSVADRIPKVSHVSLVLVTSNFNPSLYSSITQILLKRYISTSNPVTVLEVFLQVITRGCCLSEDNGTVSVTDYDITRYAVSESRVKSLLSTFGIEFIIVFTALLLKKRIVVYHTDINELATICRSLPVFVWHRLSWNSVFPLVHLNATILDDLSQAVGGYVAGFTDSVIETRTNLYDVFVNVPSQEISVAPHAKDAFTMGKLHKDLAKFLIQCTQDESKSDTQCIKEIAIKTKELLEHLKSLGEENKDGKVIITSAMLQEKQLPSATKNFLFGLASAEGLLQM